MNAENTFARWDDVVFENRNKAYGSYLIRNSYHKNLSRASFSTLLFAASLMLVYYASTLVQSNPVIPKVIKDQFTEIITEPVIILDPPAQKQILKPQQTVAADVVPQVVVTEPVNPPPMKIQTTISTTGVEGGTDVQSIDGSQTQDIGVQPVEEPKILDRAEIMPAYEGGLTALYRFLGRNLRYPTAARKMGEKGTVFVRFVIDASGAVTNVEIARGVSASLDREAMRVVALMPRWKPGLQHNTPVSVRMLVPIKFEYSEE